ncbi:MAG: hypothetical protein IT208_13495 [Chthonomonadales bacterium]|nr:hypothetical protein [Chthonomonadales bacterium]
MGVAWGALAGVLCAATAGATASPGVGFRVAQRVAIEGARPAAVALLVSNRSGERRTLTVRAACRPGAVEPAETRITLGPRDSCPLVLRATLAQGADAGVVTVSTEGASASIPLRRGIDLTSLVWRQAFAAADATPEPGMAAPGIDDADWTELRVPALWADNRDAWCRVRFEVPTAWRGRPLWLAIAAVDDDDVTYLNGVEIGRTGGWDRPRHYALPANLVRWGEPNVVAVRVANPTFGGGLYKAPIALLAGDALLPEAPASGTERAAARLRPGPVGPARPLRPMAVRDGVLRYPDGREVALWGVNYYPQSWHQFVNMRRLGVNMKAVMRQDLDHLEAMGVEAIRIHVFDREISDGKGALVPNEHLDLLDYLVSECSHRGIYLYLTPIAWWGGPNEQPGAFSAETSKPGMVFMPAAREAAAAYLRAFLTRRNPYTGRAYRDEPCLCALEVMNEPAYFLFGDLYGSAYGPQGERPDVLARDHQDFRRAWRAWLAEAGLDESPVFFPLFRYQLMRRYVTEMVAAIRSTGARQPVAISYFGANGDDITQAIADSECDAVTVSAYPGGWEHVNDGINLLPQMAAQPLPAALAGKARLAYEFDTPATNTSCYLFPVLAAYFRAQGVQIACQFQYDSISTARWNTDWNAHWLNWLYTPSKAVSYMVGGETFRRLPREARFALRATEAAAGPMAVSFERNTSLLAAPGVYMQARPAGAWRPLPLPREPARMVAVGSSPYVEYGGTGIYTLDAAGAGTLRLRLNPDARLVGNCLRGGFESPVGALEEHAHLFRLKLAGWRGARCVRLDGVRRRAMARVQDGWLLRPGVYEIRR